MVRFINSRFRFLLFPAIFLVSSFHIPQNTRVPDKFIVSVIWRDGKPKGEIIVKYGRLEKLVVATGTGEINANQFAFNSPDEARLDIIFSDYSTERGSGSTLVTINSKEHPFTFFLRDVNSLFPIYVPEYKVVVLPGNNLAGYAETKKIIEQKHLKSKIEILESEKEESFDSAAVLTRDQPCPSWLGISRDVRIFRVDFARKNEAHEYESITPRMAARPVRLNELNDQEGNYVFAIGRGQGPILNSTRRLENGVMPILHTTLIDEDIRYSATCFTSFEKSDLVSSNLKGTNYRIADHFSYGHMFTKDQQADLDQLLKSQKPEEEETVLYFRVEAENTSSVPRYAWFKTPRPAHWSQDFSYNFRSETGLSVFNDSMVFCISKLNGKPLHDEEMAILLQPGEKAKFDFYLPHVPISNERAMALSQQSFDKRYAECRQFWQNIIERAPSINLPEKRIQEMMYAGLIHLDLITYGNEPSGTLAPMIGIYSPIGTESSPIIQYYNSMGWKNEAKRSLQYFLDNQHDDGMIQNFGGYMIETGAALWSMGEYFRYTRDKEWVRLIEPKLLKACDFLINWRKQNLADSLKGKGYGMIAGKVADPNDDYHQFMLNAYAYLGMTRVAEMLGGIDPINAARINNEAVLWRSDIRDSFFKSLANSPVVPLGNGTWCPTVAPWTESTGPQSLYADPGNSFSHGTFTTRDVLLGPLYLAFCEVLNTNEEAARQMLDYHSELYYQNNAVFSQPYYSRHDWLELKLGLVRSFLKTYYTTVSALADRETYNFWEHLYHVSENKTHEEAWFLMETRWMLYMEDKDTLRLLPGIPRAWLTEGKEIKLKNMVSYFGHFSLEVLSNIKEGVISASISCDPERKPATIILRLPHPANKKARSVSGGVYDPKTETVKIAPFTGKVNVELKF